MIVSSQCDECKHLRAKAQRTDPNTCDAFPAGIPDEVLWNRHDHKKPYPGDNGVRFEPIKPAAAE